MSIYNHMDISMKYGFAVLGRFIHDFFKLEGEYKHDKGTEVITYKKRNLRMDIAYYRKDNVINNIENQTNAVDEKKLEDIAEYAKFLLIHNEALVNAIVISKVDPKYCAREIALTESLFLRPLYIYMEKFEIIKLLNTITYKINNNIKLSYDESIALAILPTLAPDDIAEEVTIEICQLICKDKFIDESLKNKICFVVEIMVDRNITKKSKKQELLEMLNMEEKRTILQAVIANEMKHVNQLNEQQHKKEIEAKNNEIDAKDNEIEAKNSEIRSKDDEIRSKDDEIRSKDSEIRSKDSEIRSKDNEILLMKKLLEEKEKQEEIDKMKKQMAEKDKFTLRTILNNNDLDENMKKSILSSLSLI